MKRLVLLLATCLALGMLWFLGPLGGRGTGVSELATSDAGAEARSASVELRTAEASATEPRELAAVGAADGRSMPERTGELPRPAEAHELPALLRVRLVDEESGAPVPGLPAALVPADLSGADGPRRFPSATSDGEGLLAFDTVPDGEPWELRVWEKLNGLLLASRSLEPFAPGEQRELTLELALSSLRHWFLVLDAESRTPLSDVSAHALPLESGAPPLARSAPDGLLVIERRPELDAFALEAEGYATLRMFLDGSGASPDEAAPLLLSRAASLDVHLVSKGDGSPAGQRVVVDQGWQDHGPVWGAKLGFTSGPGLTGVRHEVTTDAQGLARFRGLCVRNARSDSLGREGVPLHLGLATGPEGTVLPLLAEPLFLEPGAHRELTLSVGGAARVSGRVIDQRGAPVGGCRLWLARAQDPPPRTTWKLDMALLIDEVETDEQGAFELGEVPAGRWVVFVANYLWDDFEAPEPSQGVVDVGLPFEVDGSGSPVELLLETPRGLTIEGLVVDAAGRPRPSGSVSASAVAEGHVVQVQCDDMGQFRLGPLLDEEYHVFASEAEAVLARPGDRLTLKVGDRGELRAVLVGEPDPLLRSVAVTWIQTVEGGPFGYCSLGSSQSPVLELEGAPEGVYSVLVAAPDGRVAWARGLQLRAGVESDPVELRWEPGARLAARVAAPGSDDPMLLLRRSGDPIAVGFYEGGASLELVAPAGHAQLELWVGRELRTSRPVDLRAGERLEVDLGAD